MSPGCEREFVDREFRPVDAQQLAADDHAPVLQPHLALVVPDRSLAQQPLRLLRRVTRRCFCSTAARVMLCPALRRMKKRSMFRYEGLGPAMADCRAGEHYLSI